MRLAIETEGLTRRFGAVTAVDGLSLQVAEGELYAFLGLNGAGKTTTIRMLLGMIRPSAGLARVLGIPVRLGAREPWAAVGYMVETPASYPELTVRENLEASRRLHPGTPTSAVGYWIERLELAPYADRPARTLSHGNAQRLGLAKALLHAPRLLLLDEPANGLDPAGIVEIRRLLQELTHEQGVTVFMSSHILAEVTRLAQRIGIIHRGRLLRELDIDALERERRRTLRVQARDLAAAAGALAAAGHPVGDGRDGVLTLTGVAAVARPDDIATLLVAAGAPPTGLTVEEEDLEQYFLRLVGLDGGGA